MQTYSLPRITMGLGNTLLSACAGEFIHIGLSADTIHRRHHNVRSAPDSAAAVIITTGRRTAAVCALTTFHGKRAE
jgi:hypothetical protein